MKRKSSTSSVSTNKKSRVVSKELIYKVQCVQVGRGNFHYFGKTLNGQLKERLQPSWMRANGMSDSWRKHKLRGKRLNKWTVVPIGKTTEEKPSSMNPCIAGTPRF